MASAATAVVSEVEGGWERRRRRIRDELEAISLELFAKQGFDDVTVEQIADAAGISVRTFFRYFATKEDVLLVEPNRFFDSVFREFDARPASESVLEALAASIEECDYWQSVNSRLSVQAQEALAGSADLANRILGNAALVDRLRGALARRLGVEVDDLRVQVYAAAIQSASAVVVSNCGANPNIAERIETQRRAFRALAELS